MMSLTKYRKRERCSEMGSDMQRARKSGTEFIFHTYSRAQKYEMKVGSAYIQGFTTSSQFPSQHVAGA